MGGNDESGLRARLELQARLLEVMRHELEELRQARDSKDRETLDTWRRLHLHEMLLAQSQRDLAAARAELAAASEERARLAGESARLADDLRRLRSTWSWRLTTPLRRLGGPRT